MTQPMDDTQIDELLAGITQCEWVVDRHADDYHQRLRLNVVVCAQQKGHYEKPQPIIADCLYDDSDDEANARFIAAARPLIHQLRSQRDDYYSKWGDLHETLGLISGELREAEQRTQRAYDELAKETEESAQLRTRLQQVEGERDEARITLSKEMQHSDQMLDQRNLAQQQLADLQREREGLQAENLALKDEIDGLRGYM